MQKYDIPSTTGCYGLTKRLTVILAEKQCKDDLLPIKRFGLSWPDSPAMIGVISDIVEVLNDTLEQRGLNLKWYYITEDCGEDGISVQGLWWVTKKVCKKAIRVIVDGKPYRLDAEKLETLLKSLEAE